uniref:Uncharacterized protein LOC111126867 n=1 Tax=Crassostrea virginica TaxID=6565 RepID=A0A8B8DHW8_CRAVI|nr:uncharacterized protein LOC111126867 [Crassostrea virginica]
MHEMEVNMLHQKLNKERSHMINIFLLAVNILSLIAALLMTFESNNIKNVQLCDLQKALGLIFSEYTPHPCKYNGIHTNSRELLGIGIGFSVLSFIVFGIALIFYCKRSKNIVTNTLDNDEGSDNNTTDTANGHGRGNNDIANRPGGGDTGTVNRQGAGNTDTANRPGGGNTDTANRQGAGNTDTANGHGRGNTDTANRPGGGNTDTANRPGGGNTDTANRPGGGNTDTTNGHGRGNNDTAIRQGEGKFARRIFIALSVKSVVTFLAAFILYILLIHINEEYTDIDYDELDSKMLIRLETYYASDDINSGNDISIGWNNLFLKYDCCAVHEVTGTTNDFDNTPWCTTSGSCQATSSQIPKTCCKGVTKDNYQSASSNCHASVNSGTFKQSCISRMKTLSIVNIDVNTVTTLKFSIFFLLACQLLAAFLWFGLALNCPPHSNVVFPR